MLTFNCFHRLCDLFELLLLFLLEFFFLFVVIVLLSFAVANNIIKSMDENEMQLVSSVCWFIFSEVL